MPVTYRIEKKRKLVVSTALGLLTFHDASEYLSQLESDAHFSLEYGHLWDFAGVTEVAFKDDDIAGFAGRPAFSASSRHAFVAPSDLAYGLARRFESYLELAGVTRVETFRDKEEALRWLKAGNGGGRQAELGFPSPE